MRQKAKLATGHNLINWMMANNSTAPIVGGGATELALLDRYPWQVVDVSPDQKTVVLERYHATHDSTKEGGMGHQNWAYSPTGQLITIHYRQGAWRQRIENVEFIDYDSLPKDVRTSDELWDENGFLRVVDGITQVKVTWPKFSVIFGRMEHYHCWEF